MELDLSEPSGTYPHRLTHEDRFQFRVKVQPVADRLEYSIRACDTRLAANAARREWEGFPVRGKTSTVAKDPQDCLNRSKMRAKGMVRLLALQMGIDRMFTFTIRLVGSPMPYDDVLKAWDLFRRSMEKHYPDFRYIATPETQKNGQWHIHAGTAGFMNINILRRLWQFALNRVLGRDLALTSGADSPGTVNIATRGKLLGDKVRKSTKIANYISKYIGKSMEVAFNRKKYFHTYGVQITPAQRRWLQANTREGALLEVMRTYGLLDEEAGIFTGFDINVWRRDSCSAWFAVDIDSIPPPF